MSRPQNVYVDWLESLSSAASVTLTLNGNWPNMSLAWNRDSDCMVWKYIDIVPISSALPQWPSDWETLKPSRRAYRCQRRTEKINELKIFILADPRHRPCWRIHQNPEDSEASEGFLQRQGVEQVHQPGRSRRLRSSCPGRHSFRRQIRRGGLSLQGHYSKFMSDKPFFSPLGLIFEPTKSQHLVILCSAHGQ